VYGLQPILGKYKGNITIFWNCLWANSVTHFPVIVTTCCHLTRFIDIIWCQSKKNRTFSEKCRTRLDFVH